MSEFLKYVEVMVTNKYICIEKKQFLLYNKMLR